MELKTMRVLFCNRNPAIIEGGDTGKIRKYWEELEKVGVTCGYTFSINGAVDYSEWDIFHIFHLGHDFSYKFHLEAQRLGKPTVISPIYFPRQKNPDVYRREMLEYSSAVCYLSEGEKNEVHKLFDNGIELNEYIIPNGIDPIFGYDGMRYIHPNCPDEDYVLCVGRLDERKNQHRLAEACRQLDIPLVLIGEPNSKNVTRTCQGIADKWEGLWWEHAVDHELLAEAYRGAKVLACPSTLEIWPNVVAEGGLSGCNLVVSTGSMTFSDLEGVWSCEPTVESIGQAVAKAYNAEKTGDLIPYFRQFTWEKAIDQLRDAYESFYVV
jgi:glycosyltransferase involved in cell wall biosynthesis